MLKLDDKWIWDFWFAEDNEDYHVFYLQAPKSLIDERRRHKNATIGHAVSNDLINWTILPDALSPSNSESWDDLATWTGSIIKKDQLWYMFYTGVSKIEKGLIQRIGVATSSDLVIWHKNEHNPIIVAEPKWYELLDLNSWHDHAWRDPYVFQNNGSYFALITSRVNYGPADGRGVIGLAESHDLIRWKVLSPVTTPGDFGQLEVPQYVRIDSNHYILFSSAVETTSKKRSQNLPYSQIKTGTYFLKSDSPTSNYILPKKALIIGDNVGSQYSGKIIKKNGELLLITFHNYDSNNNFLGYIGNPVKINLSEFFK